jgi:hypothetical protein
MLRIYLVRHGQTAWNHSGRIQGHSDVPLETVGLLIKLGNKRTAMDYRHTPSPNCQVSNSSYFSSHDLHGLVYYEKKEKYKRILS